MDVIQNYTKTIEVAEHRDKMTSVLTWIAETFPQLEIAIKWNQPMFIDHGTFIIGFSRAKNHMSFSPEALCLNTFFEDIKKAGYEHTKGIVKIKWTEAVDYDLLEKTIAFNISDKATCETFFRKEM